MKYKAPDNSLHDIAEEYAYMLPAGCVPISDEEAEPQKHQATYAELRRAEYPSLLDLIDGIVKNDQQQIDAYRAACLAVKTKYPKP